MLVFAFYRYKVGGFILTRVKILRVSQELFPDAICFMFRCIHFHFITC